MAETRSSAEVRRVLEAERQGLASAVGELRAGLAEGRAKRLKVAKVVLAATVALLAAARLRRRR